MSREFNSFYNRINNLMKHCDESTVDGSGALTDINFYWNCKKLWVNSHISIFKVPNTIWGKLKKISLLSPHLTGPHPFLLLFKIM